MNNVTKMHATQRTLSRWTTDLAVVTKLWMVSSNSLLKVGRT